MVNSYVHAMGYTVNIQKGQEFLKFVVTVEIWGERRLGKATM